MHGLKPVRQSHTDLNCVKKTGDFGLSDAVPSRNKEELNWPELNNRSARFPPQDHMTGPTSQVLEWLLGQLSFVHEAADRL